jgi:hypothetical protein
MSPQTQQLEGFDFLKTAVDNEMLRASAQNILDSYAHPWDILSESLQNAVDAVELNCKSNPDGKKNIRVVFDCPARSIEVSDTGIGITASQLMEILAPGKSLKRGMAGLRGEKGVGMSFMVFSCNMFKIETCDGNQTVQIEISDAASWIRGTKPQPPRFSNVKIMPAQVFMGSKTYTRVWLEDISPKENAEEDILEYTKTRLIHVLRSRTAIGHTYPLFHNGSRPPIDIKVELQFTDKDGTRYSAEDVDYSYASPAQYLQKSHIITLDKYNDLVMKRKQQKVRGKCLVADGSFISDSGREVRWFAFAASRRLYDTICEQYQLRTDRGNDLDSGIFVACKGMPTGIQLAPPRSAQASYWPSFLFFLSMMRLNGTLVENSLAGESLNC